MYDRPMPRLSVALLLLVVGCSSEATEPSAAAAEQGAGAKIEVSDDPKPLSTNPGDDLCRIKLTAGGPFVLSELSVTIQFGPGTPATFTELSFVDDANKNQKLDVGETFLVGEGGSSPFGEGYASQSATVSVVRGGKVIASGRWDVKN